jgi:chorismate mutase
MPGGTAIGNANAKGNRAGRGRTPADGEGRAAVAAGDQGGRLAGLRGEIDAIDDRLLELLCRRAEIAAGLGGLKPEARDAGREAAVLERLSRANPGPLPDAALARIFGEIFSACLEAQGGASCGGPGASLGARG